MGIASWFGRKAQGSQGSAAPIIPGVRPQTLNDAEVSPAVADVFEDIRSTMGIPFVPNIMRSQGVSEAATKGVWGAFSNVFLGTNLPLSLASMILYCISADKNCEYCSAVHLATCKSTGVDQETLRALQNNLSAINPRRSQICILFAMKSAADPAALTDQDFAELREEGISEEEIVEIIALAALGNYLDTIADSLQLQIDDVFKAHDGG